MKIIAVAALSSLIGFAHPVAAADDWTKLLVMSGTKVAEVKGATRIDVTTAKSMFDDGHLFVDVQGFFEFRTSHVPGAILGASITEADLIEVAEKSQPVIFYCECDLGSPTCNLSPKASAKALSWGFEEVYFFTDYHMWQAAGHPTETGS
jgi:rhodanese-related sulfurtransferase